MPSSTILGQETEAKLAHLHARADVPAGFPSRPTNTRHLAAILFTAAVSIGVAIPVTGNRYILSLHIFALLLIPAFLPVLKKNASLRTLWICSFVWGVGQAFSNWLHGGDQASVAAVMGFLVVAPATLLWWIVEAMKVRPSTLLMALTVGWLWLAVFDAHTLQTSNPWKFGLATPVLLLGLSAAWRFQTKGVSVVLTLMAFAGCSLAFDSRFYAVLGALLVAGVVVHSLRLGRVTARHRRGTILVALSLLAGAYFVYPLAASSGVLGDRAEAQQTLLDARGANFVVVNRAEFFQAGFLAARHPLTGIGAKVPLQSEDRIETLAFLESIGDDMTPARVAYLTGAEDANLGFHPHSAALDSVLLAGFGAMFFWFYAGRVIVGRMQEVAESGISQATLVWGLGGLSLWNALFSPLDWNTMLTFIAALFVCSGPANGDLSLTDSRSGEQV